MQKMNKIIILMFSLIILSSFASADLTTSILSYYKSDVSGSTLIDSLNNYNGTISGATFTASGKINGAYDYDGLNDATTTTMSAENINDPNSGDFSIGMWFKADDVTTLRFLYDTGGASSGSRGSSLFVSGGSIGARARFSNLRMTPSGGTINTGIWYFLVMTWNQSENRLIVYLNETAIINTTTTAAEANAGTSSVSFGKKITDSDYFNGIMDEIGIWDRILNISEVSDLYNNSYGKQYPFPEPATINYFSISAKSFWDNSTINTFNASINGTSYGTTNGTIQTNIPQNETFLYDIIVYNTSTHFNHSINNYNTTSNLEVNLKQSQINISVYKEFEGSIISNYNITIDGNTFNITGNNGVIYPDTGNYNVTSITDNAGTETYTLVDKSLSVSNLDNKSVNFTVAGHIININAISLLDGSAINNFTTTLIGLNFTDNRSNTTTTGLSSFRVNDGSFNITIDANNYALDNNTIILVVDNTKEEWNYTFYLLTTNSLNITFRDIITNQILNGTNITVTFIGGTAQENNTLTGGLYVDLLSPSEYTILYNADNYRQGSYILTLTNRSTQELTLYMSSINDTQLVLIKVRDEFNSVVKNANVIVQRYVGTSWITDQIVKTDFNGQTEAYYVISTEFYNHLVTVNGQTVFGVINSNDDKKTIYAEDVANGITITVNLLVDSSLPTFFNSEGLTYSINYTETSNTTGYFTYRVLDPDGNQHDFDLEVYKTGELLSVCNSSATSSSAILICNINESSGNRVNYVAKGKVDGFVKLTLNKIIGAVDQRIDWGVSGYIFAFFVMIIIYFSYLASPTISLWFGTIAFVGFSLMGLIFKDMSYGILMVVVVLTYLIATIKSESGVNS